MAGSGKSKRRDKGDGSIHYRQSDKRWAGSFLTEKGQKKYVYSAVGGTKREAKLKLDAAIAADRRGQLVASSSQTLGDYLESWIEEKRLGMKPGVYPVWRNMLSKHIVPDLGSYQLQALRREHVQAWIKLMSQKQLKASSIHQVYIVLHVALSEAEKIGKIGVHPCQHIALPRIEEEEMSVLDLEQARTFLAFLAREHHSLEALFALAITTGMRRGELLALRWSDVDFEAAEIHIQRTVQYVNHDGYKVHEPKTRGSRRTVMLPRDTVRILREHRMRQLEENASALLFPGTTGSFRAAHGVNMALKRALTKAGLPEIRFHDLRHTAATLLLRSGASLKSVQKTLGHSNIQTTMRYLHVLSDMAEEDMRRLNESLFAVRTVAR